LLTTIRVGFIAFDHNNFRERSPGELAAPAERWNMNQQLCALSLAAVFASGCGGGATDSTAGMTQAASAVHTDVSVTVPPFASDCAGRVASASSPGLTPSTPSGLTVPSGLTIQTIANISGARELAALPNGDLIVGTHSSTVYLVPNAESSGAAGAPTPFVTMPDVDAAGVTFDRTSCTIFVGTSFGVYAIPYSDGQTRARSIKKLATLRKIMNPEADDQHMTTSVAVSNATLYFSIGSSCDACTETDPTRATIQEMRLNSSTMSAGAIRIRNAVALAVDPATGHVWAGNAGQDKLFAGHPYEFFDDLSSHTAPADYGWPECEENKHAYTRGASCSNTVEPLVEMTAYSTIIGAVFYPSAPSGTYALPATYRGSAFLAAHGSWHSKMGTGGYYAMPVVAFVPMNGDIPLKSVDWNDPTAQWKPFVSGFQIGNSKTRIGRPTGITVGSQGSLFIADDMSGRIYRVRP
jgi:glucose/arabinose dehydrogenase